MIAKNFFSYLLSIVFLSTAVSFMASQGAHAQAINTTAGLKSMAGVWEGRGKMQAQNSLESGACRGTAKPQKKKLQVAISCYLSTGEGRLVAYIGIDDNTQKVNGVWYQKFEGKQGETKGSLHGRAQDAQNLNMVLNTYGEDRAQVFFTRSAENNFSLKIIDTATGSVVYDVSFQRTAVFN